ncbi:MAG: Single-stranded-DNA-specific exonuclease RecJ [Syntrophaceae bacterium PtaU1.Bin231]|nr:MAG: Single-stranded-DNA-specific exonuclease RecJ [Syntrophaceae bacterium PtaU1.Bin231]
MSDPLPDAAALINPRRKDCSFPFKPLAAVGIVFNFLIALRGGLRREGFWRDGRYPYLRGYLDLVCLGTLGDLVPLRDENRIFVKIGLELLTEGKRTGIRALKTVCGMDDDQPVDTFRASFGLIPRINAAGRISSPDDAARLLMSDDWNVAVDLARRLDANNRKRQDMEKVILREITENIGRESSPSGLSGALVFSSPSWHPGVIGIVAARLVERYGLPAVLISLKDGIGKGSARSNAGFNIHEGLKYCASHLLTYGGHQYAAGILIREEDIPAFSLTLKDFARRGTDPDLRTGTVSIDACCDFRKIDPRLVSQIELLAPFGAANPEPLLCVRNVEIVSTSVVGNNHLRMRIASEGLSCNSIWFGKGHLFQTLCEDGASVDIVFTPRLHSWNGASEVQLKVAAVAPSSEVSSEDG